MFGFKTYYVNSLASQMIEVRVNDIPFFFGFEYLLLLFLLLNFFFWSRPNGKICKLHYLIHDTIQFFKIF